MQHRRRTTSSVRTVPSTGSSGIQEKEIFKAVAKHAGRTRGKKRNTCPRGRLGRLTITWKQTRTAKQMYIERSQCIWFYTLTRQQNSALVFFFKRGRTGAMLTSTNFSYFLIWNLRLSLHTELNRQT